jgi:hypothetical protein
MKQQYNKKKIIKNLYFSFLAIALYLYFGEAQRYPKKLDSHSGESKWMKK